MQKSQIFTPKRQHYNRFAYLLQPNNDGQNRRIQKQFSFFISNPCFQNPCASKQVVSQVKEKQTTFQSKGQSMRKSLKYELQSQNYELFRHQIDKKSTLNSFIAYTPQKSQIQYQFSIQNDISTIQYTKSNQMHTHRNLFESILVSETQKLPFTSQLIDLQAKKSWRNPTQNHEEVEPFILTKLQDNQPIKLQLSASDNEQLTKSDTCFTQKHLRTMTQGSFPYDQHNQHKKDDDFSTPLKLVPFRQLIRKSQLESIEVSEPSKNDSIQQFLNHETIKSTNKKWTGETQTTKKTKKMSQKLEESCEYQYENSISVSLNNSQSSSIFGYHKRIRLGRKTINKF